MNTTALLVDILIIGIQVLLWLSGFIFSFLFSPNLLFKLIDKSPTLSLLLLVSIAYSIGIVFDYIIAKFFSYFQCKEEKEIDESSREGLVIRILDYNLDVHKYLDNQYSRLKIVKATVFNLPLITISLLSFILINNIETKVCMLLTSALIIIIGAIMTAISIIGWKYRERTYWNYIKDTIKKMDNAK